MRQGRVQLHLNRSSVAPTGLWTLWVAYSQGFPFGFAQGPPWAIFVVPLRGTTYGTVSGTRQQEKGLNRDAVQRPCSAFLLVLTQLLFCFGRMRCRLPPQIIAVSGFEQARRAGQLQLGDVVLVEALDQIAFG